MRSMVHHGALSEVMCEEHLNSNEVLRGRLAMRILPREVFMIHDADAQNGGNAGRSYILINVRATVVG